MASFTLTAVGFAYYGHWYWIIFGVLGIITAGFCWATEDNLRDEIDGLKRMRKGDEYQIKELHTALVRERQYRQADQP
jgi:hypothetical protein